MEKHEWERRYFFSLACLAGKIAHRDKFKGKNQEHWDDTTIWRARDKARIFLAGVKLLPGELFVCIFSFHTNLKGWSGEREALPETKSGGTMTWLLKASSLVSLFKSFAAVLPAVVHFCASKSVTSRMSSKVWAFSLAALVLNCATSRDAHATREIFRLSKSANPKLAVPRAAKPLDEVSGTSPLNTSEPFTVVFVKLPWKEKTVSTWMFSNYADQKSAVFYEIHWAQIFYEEPDN